MMTRARRGTLVFGAWICCSGLVLAQVPTIGSVAPQGVKPGATTRVVLRGGGLVGPTDFRATFPGTLALAADVANNGTNAGEITVDVALPPDAQVGIHGVRVATMNGVSNLGIVVVDDLPSVAQVKPNTATAMAQVLTPPVAVDGNVDSLVRNYYKFTAAEGQKISFEVLARRIGSPLDPMIRILDPGGRELAYSDDAPGLGGDAQISHTFKAAGDYLLEVRDIRFQGGGNFTYRLRIGDFPCVTVPFPMGAKKGGPAVIGFAGSAVQTAAPVTLNLPPESPTGWVTVGAKTAGGQSSGLATLSVGAADEAVEVEPNDDQAAATRVVLGAGLNGRLDKHGDVDRFILTAKANQHFVFTGITRQQGSPTDLNFKLLKADGAQIAAADDTGTSEGILDVTFPADGDYTVVVEDLHRRGGSEFAYRIAVDEFKPGFDLNVSADTLNVPLTGTVAITVTSVRKGGYNGPIELGILDAPAGVVATPAVIGPGLNTTVMTLLNESFAPNGKMQRVRIVGKAKIGEVDVVSEATATEAQRTALAATPLPPQVLGREVILAANPQPFFTLRTEPSPVVFAPNLNGTVKIKSLRAADFPEAITLAVNPPQNGLPPGVTVAVKPVEKDKNEVDIIFTATAQAPRGDFSVNLIGTGKRGNDTVVQAAPSVLLRIGAPFAVKTEFGDAKIVKGNTLKVKVKAERIPAYAGPIVVTFANLPKGITAAEATIPENQTEVEVTLTAAADAAVGAVENVSVKGEGTANNVKFAETAPNAKLTVE